ncbi:hypothetical protein GGS26DRAFT_541551 [Hypomontagnella submonticulosa]|nr:hypothetical protein GGS26DRAFT_541551 [Hypomontagnella submonticulosa]
MPADRLLATALQAYQEAPNPALTDKILATTTTLLTNLTNPLNLSLLTTHFLTARAIWHSPDGLQTCLRVMSVYNTAAIHVRKNELENANILTGRPVVGSGVSSEDWVHAVVKGADDRSSRWLHVLVLAGVLMGMEGDDRRSLSRSLRHKLEQAVVTATNLELENQGRISPLGRGAVILALTYAFPLLSERTKRLLDGNILLPPIIEAMLGDEGFQHSDFILSITNDIPPGQNIVWDPHSPSVARLQSLESRPLAQNMGPLSRLAAFAVQHAIHSEVVLQAQGQLISFTGALLDKWSRCPLSNIDLSVETAVLPPQVHQGPYQILWQLLKKIMYTVVATLQPMAGRSLLDPNFKADKMAPTITSGTLHALRNLSFISSRQGASSFQVYTFTYNTSLDIITRYPDACAQFLQSTQPPLPQTTNVVPSPVVQALVLFYLNTAEHFPLALPTPVCENLIITPATAYLSPTTSWLTSPANNPPSSLTLELFESAHSAVLSVLSCPQHGALAAALIPFYIDALLSSFPSRISPRQFRVAFRTIMQITSPPFPVSASHPDLSEGLLEMLRFRAVSGSASTAPVLPLNEQATTATNKPFIPGVPPAQQQETISEQAALVLSLVDALPYLPLGVLEEWLARTAEAMNAIADPRLREIVRKHFWDILVSGEMDVERGALGVTWWGTGGGREMVMFGHPNPNPYPRRGGAGEAGNGGEAFMMSGALAGGNGAEGRSKL